jgi:hypothetical protein
VADTDPIETLRRAAEAAPQVLPAATGDVIATYMYKGVRGELNDEWDHVLDVAAEVLALAEQQQTPAAESFGVRLAREGIARSRAEATADGSMEEGTDG